MTGPQDPAVTGGDRLPAAHADREQVIETLRDAFTQGRLTSEELDERTGRALAAYAELDAVTADIPGVPRTDAPPASPGVATAEETGPPGLARTWPLVTAAVKSVGLLVLAVVIAHSGALIDDSGPSGLGPGPHHGWTRLLLLLVLTSVVSALAILGRGVIASVEQRRSRKQTARGEGR